MPISGRRWRLRANDETGARLAGSPPPPRSFPLSNRRRDRHDGRGSLALVPNLNDSSTDHNHGQPSTLLGADESPAPQARRLVQTQWSYRDKFQPAPPADSSREKAGAAGLEPATPGFGDRCSTKLSYAPRFAPRIVLTQELSPQRTQLTNAVSPPRSWDQRGASAEGAATRSKRIPTEIARFLSVEVGEWGSDPVFFRSAR
jgi:hypothetical protein